MELSGSNSPGGLISFLSRSRHAASRLLILIGIVLCGLGVWAYVGRGADALVINWPLVLWPAFLGIGTLTVGSWLGFAPIEPHREVETGRLAAMALAAIFGAATFVFGFAILYMAGDAVVKLLTQGEREGAGKILGGLAAIIGGLFVMFLGVQVARSEERRSVVLRRAAYGMNAFLSGFLLLAVLVVLNVIAVLKVPAAIDATRSGRNSVSDVTVKLLKSLDRPLKVYVLAQRTRLREEVVNFLTNCQEQTSRMSVTSMDYSERDVIPAVRELIKKFPQVPSDLDCLLMVYGDEKPENASFIRLRDMITQDPAPGGGEAPLKFVGEAKFDTELSGLISGKEKAIVYFLQGHGEADISDSTKKTGLGRLKEKLESRSFEAKPLNFEPLSPKVPDDAKIVVIANPKQAYTEGEANTLRAFLERGGKLVALFDVPTENRTAKQIPPSGLESLLASCGVDLTTDRILTVVGTNLSISKNAEVIFALPTEKSAEHPIVSATPSDNYFLFDGVRLIRAAATPEPTLHVTALFAADGPVWAEGDLQADGVQISKQMVEDPSVRAKLSKTALPLVIAVASSPPASPHVRRPEAKPKLVAFGDTTFVTNEILSARGPTIYYDLFVNSLEWLREKPANIGVEPRVYQTFSLNSDINKRESQLVWLPLLVALMTVGGLGLGVWIVRRQ